MATDIETITSGMDAALTAGLTPLGVTLSGSQVANWKLWRDTIVGVQYSFEVAQDDYKAQVQAYIDSKQLGSLSWYALKALEFQYGDNLNVNAQGQLYYAAVDATKQVVKVASVNENEDGGTGVVTLVIKAAAIVNNVLTPLSSGELLGLQDYFKARKIAGTKLLIVSPPADVIKYDVDVLYNPEYAQANVLASILAARDAFRLNFGYDPVFYKSSFELMIKNVPGVVALRVNTLTGTPDGGSDTSITLGYELQAGFFNYDNTSVLTLTSA